MTSCDKTLTASTNVRKPLRARLPHSSSSQSENSTMGAITASAPFIRNKIRPARPASLLFSLPPQHAQSPCQRFAWQAGAEPGRGQVVAEGRTRKTLSRATARAWTRNTGREATQDGAGLVLRMEPHPGEG